MSDSRSLSSTTASASAATLLALLAAGCAAGMSGPSAHTVDGTVHIEDRIEQASIEGFAVPADLPAPLEWNFAEGRQSWGAAPGASPMSLRGGGGSSLTPRMEETEDALRVHLRQGSGDAGDQVWGNVWIGVDDLHRDDWSHVLVTMRTSDPVTALGIAFNRRQEGGEGWLAPGMWRYWGEDAVVVSDGEVHTYRIRADWTGPWFGEWADPWTDLGLWFSAARPSSFDLLSVTVVPKARLFGDAPVGVRTVQRGDEQRRTIYAHGEAGPGGGGVRVRIHQLRLDETVDGVVHDLAAPQRAGRVRLQQRPDSGPGRDHGRAFSRRRLPDRSLHVEPVCGQPERPPARCRRVPGQGGRAQLGLLGRAASRLLELARELPRRTVLGPLPDHRRPRAARAGGSLRGAVRQPRAAQEVPRVVATASLDRGPRKGHRAGLLREPPGDHGRRPQGVLRHPAQPLRRDDGAQRLPARTSRGTAQGTRRVGANAADRCRRSWAHPAGSFSRFGRGLVEPPPEEWEGALADSYRTRIPLMFVWPGHIPAGRRFKERVSMIALLPTVLDLAGLPQPEIMQGQSLTPLMLGGEGWEPRPVIFDQFQVHLESGELVGHVEMIDGRWAASLEIIPASLRAIHAAGPSLVTAGGWRAPRPHRPETPDLLLYDLVEDPFCLSSVNEEHPDLVSHYTDLLRAQWEAHQSLAQRFSVAGEVPLTPEQLETLRALGYVQ